MGAERLSQAYGDGSTCGHGRVEASEIQIHLRRRGIYWEADVYLLDKAGEELPHEDLAIHCAGGVDDTLEEFTELVVGLTSELMTFHKVELDTHGEMDWDPAEDGEVKGSDGDLE